MFLFIVAVFDQARASIAPHANTTMSRARPKYHIFGHVHEEGLQRKAMRGGTTFLNVSYFEELRK